MTETFYPSLDGTVGEGADADWATIRGDGGSAHADDTIYMPASLYSTTTSGIWAQMQRIISIFDISSLSGKTITSVTFSFKETLAASDNYNQSLSITSSTPASNSALTNGDYAQLGTTKFASDIDISSLSVDNYNTFTFNATGIAYVQDAIDGDGILKLGFRLSGDIDNSEPTWESNKNCHAYMEGVVSTDADRRPKLIVEYSSGAATGNFFAIL